MHIRASLFNTYKRHVTHNADSYHTSRSQVSYGKVMTTELYNLYCNYLLQLKAYDDEPYRHWRTFLSNTNKTLIGKRTYEYAMVFVSSQ